MTPSTQNLNAKLSAPASRRARSSRSHRASRRGAAPPVRIAGGGSSYRGGYIVHANA